MRANRIEVAIGVAPEEITAAFRASDGPEAFKVALEERGYLLARGDPRDYVVIDDKGGVHSLARRIDGMKAAELREFMAPVNPETVPNVEQARETIAERDRRARKLKESREDARTEADYSRGEDYVSQTQAALKDHGRRQRATQEAIRSDKVSRAGEKFRRMYIQRLSVVSWVIGLTAFGVGLGFSYGIPAFQVVGAMTGPTQAAVFALFGNCLAIWLSSILRNRQLQWSTLTLFDPDGLPPILRLGIVAGITYIFCLLLDQKVVTIGIGSLDLREFTTHPPIAILVGLIGGLSEDSLTKLVTGRVEGLTQTTPAPSSAPPGPVVSSRRLAPTVPPP